MAYGRLSLHFDNPVKLQPARTGAATSCLFAHGQPDEDSAVTPTRSLKRLSQAHAGLRDFFFVDEIARRGIAIQPFAEERGSRANLFGFTGVAFTLPEDSMQRGSLKLNLAVIAFDADGNKGDPVFGRGAHHLIADFRFAPDRRRRLRVHRIG